MSSNKPIRINARRSLAVPEAQSLNYKARARGNDDTKEPSQGDGKPIRLTGRPVTMMPDLPSSITEDELPLTRIASFKKAPADKSRPVSMMPADKDRPVGMMPADKGRSEEIAKDEETKEIYDSLSQVRNKFGLMVQLLPRIQSDNPGCSLSAVEVTGKIVLEGSRSSVKNARLEMKQVVIRMHMFPVDIGIREPYLDRVLQDHRCQAKQKQWLQQHNTVAHVYDSQGCLMAAVERKSDEDKVKNLLCGFYKCYDMSGQKHFVHLLKTFEYRSKVEELEEKYCVFFSQSGRSAVIYGVAGDVDTAKEKLDVITGGDIYEEKNDAEVVLECEELWRFIDRHMKVELRKCLTPTSSNSPPVVVKSADQCGPHFVLTLTGYGNTASVAMEAIKHDILPAIHSLQIPFKGKSVLHTMPTWAVRQSRIESEDACILKSVVVEGAQDADRGDRTLGIKNETVKPHQAAQENISVPKDAPIPNLEVKLGSIHEFQADVIVCPVGLKKKTLAQNGAIPKAIAQVDGTLEKAYAKKVPDSGLLEGGIVTVETSGDLASRCKHVIFLGLTYWRSGGSEGILQQMITDCLKEAVKLKASSIAFPTLGCGFLQYPLDRVASCLKMCTAKAEFQKIKVEIACFNESTKRAVMSAPASLDRAPKPAWKPRKRQTVPPKDRKKTLHDLLIQVYSASEEELRQIQMKITQCVSEIVVEETVPLTCWDSLTDEAWNVIMKHHSDSLYIIPDEKKKELVLSGESHLIIEVKQKLEDIQVDLSDFNDPQKHRQLLGKQEFAVPDYWTSSSDQFSRVPLQPDMYKAVEKMVMGTFDSSYKIGLGHDAAYLSGYKKMEIINIERIENASLYERYWSHRQRVRIEAAVSPMPPVTQLCDESGKNGNEGEVIVYNQGVSELNDTLKPEINEHFLLHGTKSGIVDTIIKEGLDFRLAEEGGLFGRGIYLAESLSKADQYADPRDARTPVGTPLTLLVVRVVLGNICLINPLNVSKAAMIKYKYKHPPCLTCRQDQCWEHSARYDSVLGVTNGSVRMLFREYVIYHRDQCYPEYIVTYKRVP